MQARRLRFHVDGSSCRPDKLLTRAIVLAAETISLRVVDHLVVSSDETFSFKQAVVVRVASRILIADSYSTSTGRPDGGGTKGDAVIVLRYRVPCECVFV